MARLAGGFHGSGAASCVGWDGSCARFLSSLLHWPTASRNECVPAPLQLPPPSTLLLCPPALLHAACSTKRESDRLLACVSLVCATATTSPPRRPSDLARNRRMKVGWFPTPAGLGVGVSERRADGRTDGLKWWRCGLPTSHTHGNCRVAPCPAFTRDGLGLGLGLRDGWMI